MRKLLTALFVALLMVGCGEEAQKKAIQTETKDDPSVPLFIPCEACGKEVSKKAEKCLDCEHPATDSVVAYKAEQELARIRIEEERKAEPFGGIRVLVEIKEAKESGATKLVLSGGNRISDLSPLAELTNLEELVLGFNQITDVSPLAGLTKLKELDLFKNQITDVSPLAGLTKLEYLNLYNNEIAEISPLKGLTKLKELELRENPIPKDQKEMLKKALPHCSIKFD